MTDLYDQMARFAEMAVQRGVYDVEEAAFDTNPKPFLKALASKEHPGGTGCGLVVEVRVPEPSMGRIPKDLDVERHVREMLRKGAAAVGVMVEQMKFGGNLDLVGMSRQGAPVCVRDFVVDPVQVRAARRAGASAVTLDLGFHRQGHADLPELLAVADDEGLEALVQVPDAEGVEEAAGMGAEAVGLVVHDPVTRTRRDGLAEEVLGGGDADAATAPDVPVVLMGGVRDHAGYARARELGAHGVWVDGPLVGHRTPWTVVEAILGG